MTTFKLAIAGRLGLVRSNGCGPGTANRLYNPTDPIQHCCVEITHRPQLKAATRERLAPQGAQRPGQSGHRCGRRPVHDRSD
jgi:hypothetical protein